MNYYLNYDINNLEGEIWKPIKDWKGSYSISSLGRIKSLDRVVPKRNGTFENRKGRILRQGNDTDGYLIIGLYSFKKGTNKKIHRLVGEAFVDNPLNLPCINHLDGNKKNNLPNNLGWCTVKENNIHAFSLGLKHNRHSIGEGCNFSKLKELQVKDIRAELLSKKVSEVAELFNVSEETIYHIKAGRTWKNVK